MKKSLFIAILGFLLIVVFGLIVLDTKLYELKVTLEKRKLFNFSFSSEILRSKFESILSNRENIRAEMNLNNLQSSLIESNQLEKFSVGILQNFGSVLINSVRFVTGKPPIDFEISSTKIRLLEHSFTLERNQAYKEAYQAYGESLKTFAKGTDESGFILLHQGFCLAVQGEFDHALKDLESVLENNPGTVFANDAEILIAIVQKSKQSAKEIEENFDSPESRARAYFAKGNYPKVLEEFAKSEMTSAEMKYIQAYSFEKTGNQNVAITEYAKLAFSNTDKEIAIKANRRLMMLGHYYNAGNEIVKISDKNAERLGDRSEAAEIKASSEKLKRADVEDNLSNPDKTSHIDEKKSLLSSEIQEVVSKSEAFLKKAEEEAKVEAKNYIAIQVSDSVPVYGDKIIIDGDETKLFSAHFPITLATYTIDSITVMKNSIKNSRKLLLIQNKEKIPFLKAIFEDDQSITLIEKNSKKKLSLSSPIQIELSK
ncbi:MULTISPECIES: tetratricopeptide repeat protein [Leptospira]|uniref:Tetratricopeptide repeat protein n=5 Tax=Leptospira borgpetersenii TaxID=174 RepID=M3GB79_LEPBO|nr:MULTISPECIES: tetratricopeptide repeat protein [Leptospira]EMF98161.1 tetratricopeptide repeat protein [Leptospira borgpetersenii str. 200701203]ALO28256.1 hypothetical protein LBBP_04118 [Leptospira borgpetersenii serovar Ballum]APY25282.1 Uncharacterized protein LB4E_3235 [Leptospira borgpetersenii str. 4E]AXX17544.1 hypothetical protein C4Q31_18520 [Leptospira borgpetersenii serovar Ceylonica]EKP11581.1 tetratricopeptide repeat protein [Leptospira borgpetersenii str. 200801926]